MKITEHHPHYDFEALFREAAGQYVGVDINDFENLFRDKAEVHSFMSEAAGAGRTARCVEEIEGAVCSVAPMENCSRLLLYLQFSREAATPFLISEIAPVKRFVERMPAGCDVVWGYGTDPSLGDNVRIIALAALD